MATPFIALEAPSADQAQVLTPLIMAWSPKTWVLDLGRTLGYWRLQAARAQMDLLGLWRTCLQRTAGDDAPVCIGQAATYRAALAPHPWQAVLLLSYMRERRIGGLVDRNSPFGRSLYEQLSWTAWHTAAAAVEPHYAGHLGFKLAAFRRAREQLARAVKRLGFTRPGDLGPLEPAAIKRRFGATLMDLWQWTYPSVADEGTSAFAPGFPWSSYVPAEKPRIKRHLDHPLLLWEHLAPLLAEDLDRLCGLDSWGSGERVVRLTWQLWLACARAVEVPIVFRHPHSLHRERGEHKTTLLQAFYSFSAQAARTEQAIDSDDSAFAVASWELVVDERLVLPGRVVDLFGQSAVATSEEAALLELENKLPIDLESFELRADWLPEDSFGLGTLGRSEEVELRSSLQALARRRPLFLYKKPELLAAPSRGVFLERTMAKWWVAGGQSERDYYCVQDDKARVLWVYRDATGRFFVHGVFA